ncbi:hydrogenase maturation protease [Amycolatopsis minnesotensis]|uniref:Hydrogenase maturation protease n=1 Tax=Amycolatopsis minnesotensis TaxID=337894 RepID=A0ABP5C4J5_9PSEU
MTVLVAGVGNIFLGDDGFGAAVVRRLSEVDLGDDVEVADYGISGMHLAYDLTEAGYDLTILVDAASRGGEPGTVYVIELDPGEQDTRGGGPLDAHGMRPDTVLALLRVLGGDAGRVLLVGCEPAELDDRIGLSPPVHRAVETAVRAVTDLVAARRAGREPVGPIGTEV